MFQIAYEIEQLIIYCQSVPSNKSHSTHLSNFKHPYDWNTWAWG